VAGAGTPDRLPHRRRWWRWIAEGAGALIALSVLATGLFIELGPSSPPLVLPMARASASAGPVTGTWSAGPPSPTWGITQPGGFGILGSLADHGAAEFLLILHRR
jgi:hypothetical protein